MDYAESYQQNLENFLISAKYGDFFILNPLSNGSLDWDVKFDEYGTLSLSINNERNVTESGFRNGVELIFDLGKGRLQKKSDFVDTRRNLIDMHLIQSLKNEFCFDLPLFSKYPAAYL